MDEYRIGIISDTHGFLSDEIHKVFRGVDLILHAGDIGSNDILIELETIAPVKAVYGNMDGWTLRKKLQERLEFELFDYQFSLTHMPGSISEKARTIRIFGHTHFPEIVHNHLGIIINPGSASKPRGAPAASVVILTLADQKKAQAEIIYLEGKV